MNSTAQHSARSGAGCASRRRSTYGLDNGAFRFDTQAADLYVDSNNASVLTEPAPTGNYVVETKVKLNLPAEGCCYNYVQAGLVIYGDDDNFIKLATSRSGRPARPSSPRSCFPCRRATRATATPWSARPSEWTYLRIVKRTASGEELYTAYTSRDGQRWVRGGTWTHQPWERTPGLAWCRWAARGFYDQIRLCAGVHC